MWLVKFLTGPQAGKTAPLHEGRNVVGRSPKCDVVIPSANVSKEHAVIEIVNGKVSITDLNSRNGTFVNGVQVRNHQLRPGDRFGFLDIICEIEKHAESSQGRRPGSNVGLPQLSGNVAYDQNYSPQVMHDHPPMQQGPQAVPAPAPLQATGLSAYVMRYVDEVVLPGVYKLPQWFEFKSVLGIFVALFIVLVTALSTIPLMRILKTSIEKEAQNRAQTIARSLARDNKSAVMQGNTSLVSTANADREAGAEAYVLARSGEILAPPQLSGQYLTKIDFVNEARKVDDEQVRQINDSTIVAVAPIRFYDPRSGSDTTAAQAIVVYNMGALAIDDGRTLSLFIQILFIAVLLGALLYFFLYKTVLRPIVEINAQVDAALTAGLGQIETTYLFPELQQLASNITSAINRGAGGFASDNLNQFEADRNNEMQNLVNIIGFAAIAVTATDRVIAAVNMHFLNQIGPTDNWQGQSVDKISDQALKLNIQGLIERAGADPAQIVTDHLEISSNNYEISAQGVQGSKSLAYIVIVFAPKGGG